MDNNFQTLPTMVKLDPKDNLQIVKAEITSDLKLAIDLLNIGDKVIIDITFSVIYKDIYDNLLFNGSEFFYNSKNVNIEPHTTYYVEPFVIDERFKDARSLIIYIKSFTFSDGKTKEYNNKASKEYILPLIPYLKLEKIHNILGPEIITYGENLIDGWRCVCGATNEKESQECRYCSRNKNFVLNNLTEPLINIKLMNNLEISGNTDKKTSDIMQNLTQTRLTKIAPQAEDIEDKRINTTNIDQIDLKPKKRIFLNFIKYIFIITIILIASYFSYSFISRVYNNRQVENANNYIATGEYNKALKIYLSVNKKNGNLQNKIDYAEKLINSKNSFELGNKYITDGDFLNAVRSFKNVIPEDTINYSTSQDKISNLERIILENVKNEINSGNKEQALKILDEYLKYVPESANALSMKESITNKNISSKSLGEKINDSINEGYEFNKSRAEITKKAESLLHSYQKVKISNAKLRENPSIDSNIIVILPIDTDLYVKETKIEGEERIWCNVEAKDTKNNTVYHGWISNKAMESDK